MKIIKDKNHKALTQAQIEFCKELEASDQSGESLFHPPVAAGYPAPDCLVSIEKVCRFAVTLLSGPGLTQDHRWYREEVDDPVEHLLETAWQSAEGVRVLFQERFGKGRYVIPVLAFTGMERDPEIMEASQGRSVRVFWNIRTAVERLVDLPGEREVQDHLTAHQIRQEMAALRRSPGRKPSTSEDHPFLELGDNRPLIQHVDVANVYIVVSPDADVSLRDFLDR